MEGFGPKARNSNAVKTGGLSTQAIPQSSIQKTTTQSDPASYQAEPTVAQARPASYQQSPVVFPAAPVSIPSYTQNSITLSENSFDATGYKPISQAGISTYRPEIISIIDFLSIFQRDLTGFSSVGKFVDINFQSRILRENTLNGLLREIETQPTLASEFNNLNRSFDNKLALVKSSLAFQYNNYNQLKAIGESLDIKTLKDESFDLAQFLTLKNFFDRKMQFSNSSYDIFTETKILMQLLFDFRSMIENYSLSLLDLTDNDRINDTDSTVLDKTYTTYIGFSIDSLRSTEKPLNALDTKNYTPFINSLPTNPDDRIKLLVNFLSKELRVSRGLSFPTVRRKLEEFFQAPVIDGNPFDNLIGIVGATIFDQPAGINSLSSLLYLKAGENLVLPFENKFIDDDQTTFVPGSEFFVENILNVDSSGNYNTKPFVEYASRFNTILSEAKAVINDLFVFNGDNKLKPNELLNLVLSALNSSIQGIQQKNSLINDQLVSAGLFRLSVADKQLRLMLFQFLVLAGIASSGAGDEKHIFMRSIVDIDNASLILANSNERVNLNGGMAALYPLLAKLAEKIEERVALITNPSSSRYSVAGSAVLSKLDIGGGKTQNAQDHSKTSNQISSTPTTDDILVDKGTVKAVLLSCIATTTKTTTTLLKAFIDLSHALDQEASVSGNSNLYVLQDGTNRTRFNFISSTYILMFVFETILSFSSKYISGDFVQSSIIDKLAIKLDTRVNSSFSASILTLQKNTTDSTNLIPDSIKVNKNDGIVISDVPIIGKSSKQTNSLETLQTKLVEEDVAVKNILHILDVIGRKLTQSSRQAVSYFTTANQARGNLTTSNKNPLELSQLKVSSWILDNYLEWQQQSEGGFATSKSLSLGERNAMFSLLKDTPYTDEEEKIKLLVVGIPAGFTDKLTNRVKRAEINRNTFTNENTDLVNICVYRKSEEYDDIVFKPQKFMFDLSLFFSTPTNLDVKIEQPFEAVLKQIQLERFNSPQKELLSREEMLKRTEYSFLTQKEKETLFKNHVVSGLLETYSVLSTGLRFTEDSFMIEDLDPDSGVANPDVENLIRRYFQEIKGQTLTGGGLLELLSNPEVSEELKDEIRILAYGNNFFKSGIVESKILNQKLFDRVLILPLEMNNFEIDKDSTFSTDSGRKSYNTPKIQKLIKQTGDSEYISRQPNSIIFDNFFVSIETTR